MSALDSMHTGFPTAAGRADARYGARVAAERGETVAQRGDGSVTLEKVGDFLQLDLRRILVWLRSGLWLIVAMAVIGAAGGYAFAKLSTPRFTVSTDVLIDPANLQVVANDLFTTVVGANGVVARTPSGPLPLATP